MLNGKQKSSELHILPFPAELDLLVFSFLYDWVLTNSRNPNVSFSSRSGWINPWSFYCLDPYQSPNYSKRNLVNNQYSNNLDLWKWFLNLRTVSKSWNCMISEYVFRVVETSTRKIPKLSKSLHRPSSLHQKRFNLVSQIHLVSPPRANATEPRKEFRRSTPGRALGEDGVKGSSRRLLDAFGVFNSLLAFPYLRRLSIILDPKDTFSSNSTPLNYPCIFQSLTSLKIDLQGNSFQEVFGRGSVFDDGRKNGPFFLHLNNLQVLDLARLSFHREDTNSFAPIIIFSSPRGPGSGLLKLHLSKCNMTSTTFRNLFHQPQSLFCLSELIWDSVLIEFPQTVQSQNINNVNITNIAPFIKPFTRLKRLHLCWLENDYFDWDWDLEMRSAKSMGDFDLVPSSSSSPSIFPCLEEVRISCPYSFMCTRPTVLSATALLPLPIIRPCHHPSSGAEELPLPNLTSVAFSANIACAFSGLEDCPLAQEFNGHGLAFNLPLSSLERRSSGFGRNLVELILSSCTITSPLDVFYEYPLLRGMGKPTSFPNLQIFKIYNLTLVSYGRARRNLLDLESFQSLKLLARDCEHSMDSRWEYPSIPLQAFKLTVRSIDPPPDHFNQVKQVVEALKEGELRIQKRGLFVLETDDKDIDNYAFREMVSTVKTICEVKEIHFSRDGSVFEDYARVILRQNRI